MKTSKVSVGLVRASVAYEPSTGEFIWKSNRCSKYIGQPAGWWGANGYRSLTIGGKKLLAHRVAWVLMIGKWPVEVIDHADGDPRNNTWSNLRAASQAENVCNKIVQSNCKSGVQGVVWREDRQKWAAYINKKGAYRHLGYFDRLEDASDVRHRAALEVHGTFALNARCV